MRSEFSCDSNLNNLQLLDLESNYLTNLTMPYLFANLSNLQELNLRDNQILTLHLDVFRGLFQLEKLYLNTNRLTYLAPNQFVDLKSLTFLDLQFAPL